MILSIELSANEEANMRAWAAYLAAHPEFVGKIPTPGTNPPDGQWKIILEEQTAARYNEIAAQFGVSTPDQLPAWGTQPNDNGRGRPVILDPFPKRYAMPYTVGAVPDPSRTVSGSINEQGQNKMLQCAVEQGGKVIAVGGGAGAGNCTHAAAAGNYVFVFGLAPGFAGTNGHALIQIPA